MTNLTKNIESQDITITQSDLDKYNESLNSESESVSLGDSISDFFNETQPDCGVQPGKVGFRNYRC